MILAIRIRRRHGNLVSDSMLDQTIQNEIKAILSKYGRVTTTISSHIEPQLSFTQLTLFTGTSTEKDTIW